MTAAGKYRDRVLVLRQPRDDDGNIVVGTRGEQSEPFEPAGGKWGQFEYLSGRKLELARQLVSTATARFSTRRPRTKTFVVDDRICFDNVTWHIRAIVPSDRDHFEIICLLARVEQ